MVRLHIGFDDTDSPRGGCTTYIAALLVERLYSLVKFVDYPLLVRLNPNIPWKTRGNAAICLRVKVAQKFLPKVKEEVVSIVEEHSELHRLGTDPGIVFLQGQVAPEIVSFGERCIRDIVTKRDAMKLLRRCQGEALGYGTGRGVVGALGAIGNLLREDHTFELLAYRKPANRGTLRKVDYTSILRMNEATCGRTFNNFDPEKGRVLITPRGPDPILVGIRGETLQAVKEAFEQVVVLEELERWVVFRTNQGTDMHLPPDQDMSSARPNCPVTLVGSVTSGPRTILGGHVFFWIGEKGKEVCCAAYEPTGKLRDTVRRLEVGDRVRVFGGVRPARKNHPITVNLEKLEILSLTQNLIHINPPCPICGRHMESMGHRKGYRCKHCGLRETNADPMVASTPRKLDLGLFLPPPRAQRHLTKPLTRYGQEKAYTQVSPETFWGLGPLQTTVGRQA